MYDGRRKYRTSFEYDSYLGKNLNLGKSFRVLRKKIGNNEGLGHFILFIEMCQVALKVLFRSVIRIS